jgi:hypothetical protein
MLSVLLGITAEEVLAAMVAAAVEKCTCSCLDVVALYLLLLVVAACVVHVDQAPEEVLVAMVAATVESECTQLS